MQPCPECGRGMPAIRGDTDGIRTYACGFTDCAGWGVHQPTIEVPEKYLRELVSRSLELARLQAQAT